MQVEEFLRDNMQRTVPNYQSEGVHDAWDHLQTEVSRLVHNTYAVYSRLKNHSFYNFPL